MYVPNVKEARSKWGITAIDVKVYDNQFKNLQAYLKPTFSRIISDIKRDEYIVGLQQYNLSEQDMYALHMMLILHENIILTEENNTVKYVWINAAAKEGLGIKAYGLYWLNLELIQQMKRTFKITNPHILRDMCFILNICIGFAFKNNSPISNNNIININKLAWNLFMPFDQFLIALTVLTYNKILILNRVNSAGDYKFKFCNLIFTDIKEKLALINTKVQIDTDQQYSDNEEVDKQTLYKLKNVLESGEKYIDKLETFSDNINEEFFKKEYDKIIDYLKFRHTQTNQYYKLPQEDKYDIIFKVVLQNQLFSHPNISFQYIDNTYEFRYIDTKLKTKYFADYCKYKNISYNVVQALHIYFTKYKHKFPNINFVDIITLFDILNTKKLFNVKDITLFNQFGFFNEKQYIRDLFILNSFQLISINNLGNISINSDLQSLSTNKLIFKLESMRVNVLSDSILNKIVQDKEVILNNISQENIIDINTVNNIDENENVDENKNDINENDKDDTSKNNINDIDEDDIDKDDIDEDDYSDINDNENDCNDINENNSIEYIQHLLSNIHTLEKENDALTQQTEKLRNINIDLMKDNAHLLLSRSLNDNLNKNYKKFKQNIEYQFNMLFNQLIHELDNFASNDYKMELIRLNYQASMSKLIHNTKENILNTIFCQ